MADRIASLRVDLGFDAGDFTRGVVQAQGTFARFAHEIGRRFADLEQSIRRVGIGLTAGITAPFAVLATVSARGAATFESAMGDVHAALRGINAEQLEQLSLLARRLGPEVGRSAVEAAQGIETLALTGLSADAILNGAAEATLRLAAANDAELTPSAAALTDVMRQFGQSTSDLPAIVNNITGALDASKLSFDDFQLAISQAGGVAGAMGVSFEDFNTTIAATSSLFASGSDAGTSFKTFLQRLVPQSEDARRVMRQLNLEFFDASGRMKSMGDIAEELRNKLGNLSERSQNQALTILFGSDAMRTAIGLMNVGRERFEELQQTIGQTDAGDKLAIQLQGLEASTHRLSAAFEGLKIALGSAGLLAIFTGVTEALTSVTSAFASLPQPLLTAGLVVGAFLAALGPLTLAVLFLGRLALPLFIGRLGLLGTALVALINPIGALAAGFVWLAVKITGAGSALHLFATGLARVLGPIGLAVTALALLYLATGRTVQANAALRQSSEQARAALANQQQQTMTLAAATGEARRALIAKMQADRAAAAQALRTAMADLSAARAALIRAQATAQLNRERMRVAANDPRLMVGAGPQIGQRLTEQADADLRQTTATVRTLTEAVQGYNASLSQTNLPGLSDVSFDAPRGERQSRDRSKDVAQRREELALQQALDVATARGDIEEMRRIQALIDLTRRRNDYEDLGLNQQAAQLAAARDMQDLAEARALTRERENNQALTQVDLEVARLQGEREYVRETENRLYVTERIAFWRERELSLQEAQLRAEEELGRLEVARAAVRRREVETAERERQLDLARLRGDSGRVIRQRQREVDLERRAREIAEREGISDEAARERASLQLDEEERARLQGDFRATFRDGVRAALDGDLKGFIRNFWTEQLTRSLEDALNSVADLLYQLVNGGKGGGIFGGGGGGGFLVALGSLFGGGGGKPAVAGSHEGWHFPGFKGGGSFKVGGRGGPDMNLIQFRATRGEMVDIRRPGQEGARGIVEVRLRDEMLDARIAQGSGIVLAQAYPALRADTARHIQDSGRRR